MGFNMSLVVQVRDNGYLIMCNGSYGQIQDIFFYIINRFFWWMRMQKIDLRIIFGFFFKKVGGGGIIYLRENGKIGI